MFYKTLAVAALSLSVAGAAFAQSTSSTGKNSPTPDDMTMMESWKGPIGQAFFTDDTMTTLRSNEEIAANWATLSADQQAQVKADCEKLNSGSGSGSYGEVTIGLCAQVGEF